MLVTYQQLKGNIILYNTPTFPEIILLIIKQAKVQLSQDAKLFRV